jgi:hypothetical protein
MMSREAGQLLPVRHFSPAARIRIERRLPVPGEILVHEGDRVEAGQPVARVPAHGELHIVNVARALGLRHQDVSQVMVKKRGDRVMAGEVLAARRGFLPFLYKPCRSPADGRIAAIGYGWAVIKAEQGGSQEMQRGDRETADLVALVRGRVAGLVPGRRVTVETVGAYVAGACGPAGEASGVLRVVVDGPDQVLTAGAIDVGLNHAVLLAGADVTPEALERAAEMKVKGIIAGGLSPAACDRAAGLSLPVVATEGYGRLPMLPMIFDLLKGLEGREVSLGAQMGKAGEDSRPVVIVPLPEHLDRIEEFTPISAGIQAGRAGQWVRGVRRPWLGRTGRVAALSAGAERIATGMSLPGAWIAFSDWGDMSSQPDVAAPLEEPLHFVPWLNLEHLEMSRELFG